MKTQKSAWATFWERVVLALGMKDFGLDNAYERYLSEATDAHDLEARERQWSRKQLHGRMY